MSLLKLGDMKLTRVKGNCEKKSEIKSSFSGFFRKLAASLKSHSTVYTTFDSFSMVQNSLTPSYFKMLPNQ